MKNNIPTTGILLLLSIFTSCNDGATLQKPDSKSKKTEARGEERTEQVLEGFIPDCYQIKDIRSSDTSDLQIILDRITNIREVKKLNKMNADTITFCVMPDSAQTEDYVIRVGLDAATHFSTRFLFHANKVNHSIKILEVFDGVMLSIEDWRKSSFYKEAYQ